MTELTVLGEEENTPSNSSEASTNSTNGDASSRKRGKCKWFNVAKGWGFITPEDGSQEVFVHQSVICMTGFRSLGDEEIVEFEWKESEKGLEATLVTGPHGEECKGSHRRPVSKKKIKKIRCYNCGDLSHHIASKCNLGPQPKRCHSCKSDEHLIADCPKRIDRNKNNNQMRNNNNNNNNHDEIDSLGTSSPESNLNSEEATASTDEMRSSSSEEGDNDNKTTTVIITNIETTTSSTPPANIEEKITAKLC